MSLIIGLSFQVVQSEERKKYENQVVKLLEGILGKQGGESCLGGQDVHHTAGCDSDGLEGSKTMTNQVQCCSKPDKAKDQDRGWLIVMLVALGVVVLVFSLLWLSLRLGGDEAIWRPIFYAWAGIAVVLCFQVAHSEWNTRSQKRIEKQQEALHDKIICLLTEISGKL